VSRRTTGAIHHRLIWPWILILLWCASCRQPSTFYVAPGGDDLNSGTADRPFATLEKARSTVAGLLEKGQKSDITVILAGGTYHLTHPIEFKPGDSGQQDFKISYQAAVGAVPIVSGGIRIEGWRKDSLERWTAKVPKTGGRLWSFRELFIDGRRGIRARFPNLEYLRMKQSGADRRTNFYFNPGDFPRPSNEQQVELAFLHDWSITRIAVNTIDYERHQLWAVDTIGARTLDFFQLDHWEEHPRYFLENDLAFLDTDFEWYLDAQGADLYLRLPPNQSPNEMDIVAPLVDNLLSLEGNEGERIRNMVFRGIYFEHCAWLPPGNRYAGIQACHFDDRESEGGWAVVAPAVDLAWAENIAFESCHFQHLGGSGIRLGIASQNCQIRSCRFTDISGNGIMIGEGQDRTTEGRPWWVVEPENVAKDNEISGSTINQVGQQFFGAVGIWCGLTAGTSIRDNHLYDLPYTGISVGWMWSPDETPCRDNHITGNHIHDIMKVLSDGGGIYMLGRQPGSIIRDNHIHGVSLNAGRAESNGMFIDEGSTGILIEHNLIYDIAKSPLRFHRAGKNIVSDNILICAAATPPVRLNNTPQDNIVQRDNQILTDSILKKGEDLLQMIATWENEIGPRSGIE
jgi:hypothetical protein